LEILGQSYSIFHFSFCSRRAGSRNACLESLILSNLLSRYVLLGGSWLLAVKIHAEMSANKFDRPKFGYNTMDNGFLLFKHVKIPHINMLAKYSRVDPETSKYIRPSSPSLIYGTLTWVRSTIVLQSGGVLARGVTIATRYAAVRRQFQDRDAQSDAHGENQVLNYTMVQFRLLPLLAATFALHFTGKAMMALYQENQKKMQSDAGRVSDRNRGAGPEETHSGSDLLADLHATSCGLKALGSTTAAEGLEVCRRACGGHGYSSFGGIGAWYADYLPTTTWEGDNYMLTQQVARYVSFLSPLTFPANEFLASKICPCSAEGQCS
jgi:acyl-CoA oxidase